MIVGSLSLLAAMVPISQVVRAPAAHAEVANCGTKGNYFDGWGDPYGDGTRIGAFAYIETEYGAVCDYYDYTSANFTAAWAMISGNADVDIYVSSLGEYVDDLGWAQTGFIRWYGSDIHAFSQSSYTDPSTGDLVLSTSYSAVITTGNTKQYSDYYDSTCSCLQLLVDTTTFASTSWNPYTYWGTPFSTQYSGEAAYLASDMPGNATTPTPFTKLHYMNSAGTWYAWACTNPLTKVNQGSHTRTDGESWWNQPGSTCPDFNIYTDTAG